MKMVKKKTGRLFARQLKRLDSVNTITAIRKDDKLFTSAKKINEVFKSFYEDLYASTCSASDEDLNYVDDLETVRRRKL